MLALTKQSHELIYAFLIYSPKCYSHSYLLPLLKFTNIMPYKESDNMTDSFLLGNVHTGKE